MINFLWFRPGSGVVQAVDEEQWHGTGATAAQDVLGELLGVSGVLGRVEQGLNGVLEGEVQSLGGEVPKDNKT